MQILPRYHEAMRRVWLKWKWIEKLAKLRHLKQVSSAYKWCEDPEGNGIDDPSGKPSTLQRFCEEIDLARTLAREIDDPELCEAALKDIRYLASYPQRYFEQGEGEAVFHCWNNHSTSDAINREAGEATRALNRCDFEKLDLFELISVKEEIADARYELRMADAHVDRLIAGKRTCP